MKKKYLEGTKIEDLTGKEFGILKVLELDLSCTEISKNNESYWKCKCKCGRTKTVSRSCLMRNKLPSCGCIDNKGRKLIHGTQMFDLTGQKFNLLTAIELISNNNDDQVKNVWRCKCECGKEIIVRASSLKSGSTKSCGCVRWKREFKKQKNHYEIMDDYYIVYNYEKTRFFYIDLDDYLKIKDYYWNFNSRGYISTKRNKKIITLHKLITETGAETIIDHINNDKSDNRKSNLRPCTVSQNNRNRIYYHDNKYLGVYRTKLNKYKAHITCKDQITWNNSNSISRNFITEKEALIQRLKWEVEYFGDFAPQRHLFSQYGIEVESCVTMESTVAETLLN